MRIASRFASLALVLVIVSACPGVSLPRLMTARTTETTSYLLDGEMYRVEVVTRKDTSRKQVTMWHVVNGNETQVGRIFLRVEDDLKTADLTDDAKRRAILTVIQQGEPASRTAAETALVPDRGGGD